MQVTNEQRIEVIFDHLVYLTDQVRRLRGLLEEQGLPVPDDLGTLGPCPLEVFRRLTNESIHKYLHDRESPTS